MRHCPKGVVKHSIEISRLFRGPIRTTTCSGWVHAGGRLAEHLCVARPAAWQARLRTQAWSREEFPERSADLRRSVPRKARCDPAQLGFVADGPKDRTSA